MPAPTPSTAALATAALGNLIETICYNGDCAANPVGGITERQITTASYLPDFSMGRAKQRTEFLTFSSLPTEVDETNWGPLTVNNATPLASGALLRKTVTLYAHLGEPASPCSVTTVCLATAADRGVAARNECWPFYHEDGKPEPAISAQPGDFVIYVHKYSRLRWA